MFKDIIIVNISNRTGQTFSQLGLYQALARPSVRYLMEPILESDITNWSSFLVSKFWLSGRTKVMVPSHSQNWTNWTAQLWQGRKPISGHWEERRCLARSNSVPPGNGKKVLNAIKVGDQCAEWLCLLDWISSVEIWLISALLAYHSK